MCIDTKALLMLTVTFVSIVELNLMLGLRKKCMYYLSIHSKMCVVTLGIASVSLNVVVCDRPDTALNSVAPLVQY